MPAPARAALVKARVGLVREAIAATGASGALIERRRDAAWLTVGADLHVAQAGDAIAGSILVTPGEAVVLAPNIEAERFRDEELTGLPLEVVATPWWEPGSVAEAIAQRSAPRTLLSGATLEAALLPLRERLAAPEHERLRWLARVARLALDGATLEMRPGRTETDVAAALVGPLQAAAVRTPVVLAGADDRMRFRHPIPQGAPIRYRLMLVLVAERWGLHVAATRMAWLSGDGATHAADAAAGRVLAAMEAASRPGASLGDVVAAAAAAYEAEGFEDEWHNHHQGGTIGYAPRERIATPGDATVLEAGMALAWNPSVPGGKAEATLLVTDDAAETILA
jgi:Xaa-Pro dipeptidase